MRYFAMIDGERRGPFELQQLAEAGVRPDTYVWCKGMDDWEKAEDVADICRFYRQRIFDLMHPSMSSAPKSDNASPESQEMTADDPYADVPLKYRQMARRSGIEPGPKTEVTPDTSRPPSPTLFISLFLTLFCFPFTGFVAIYYSYKARQAWLESQRSESKNNRQLYNEQEREALRKQAHDYDRQAKMWIGITFFIGMIFYAFITHKML